MSKEFPKLRDIEIEKQIFHSSKSAISVEDENIKKILVLKSFSYSKNDSTLFIDYVNDVLLSSTTMHQISTDAWICKYLQRKQMHDQNLIKDYQLLKKYSGIRNLEQNQQYYGKKIFDSQPVLKGKYLITKAKSSAGKINTDFHDKKYPGFSLRVCVSVNSVFKLKRDLNFFLET